MNQDKPKFRIEDNMLIGEEVTNDRWDLGKTVLEKLKSKPKFMAQVDAATGKYNTFEEILEKSVKCAIWLKRQGIEPGDVLGICVHNCLEACLPVFATLYLAAIISSWDHNLSTRSASYYLRLISPKLVFVTAEAAVRMREAAVKENKDIKIVTIGEAEGFESLDDIIASVDDSEVPKFECYSVKDPEDAAVICSSSGSTGMPKGVVLSYRSLYHACLTTEAANIIGEVAIWMPTIRWHFGLVLIIEGFLSETRIILISGGNEDLTYFELIDKYGVTYFGSDPSVPLRWVKQRYHDQYDLRSVRKLVISGSHFDARKEQILAQAYPHIKVLQCYGMTESGGMVVCQAEKHKLGSCGFICRGQRIKIVDTKTGVMLGPNQVGELYTKSPYIMKGYYKNPEATKKALTKDGWLRSNDLMYYDEDGEIFFVGRISENINYRSINLSTTEIESVLESHPLVMKAAVVPVPHETDIEHPMAFITKVPGKEVTVEELMKLVKDNLPWYCMIRAGIQFLEKMPLTTTGKIARNELLEIAKHISAISPAT